MKKWMWMLLGAAGLMAGLWLLIVVLAATFDYNKLKPAVVQAVRDHTGRALAINGDIRLKIGLLPELTVADVRFQNAPWASRPQMLTVKDLEIGLALLPLLKKTVQIERLVLRELEVFLEIDVQGLSNLDFKPPDQMKKGSSGEGFRLTPAVHELIVENAKLTVIDNRARKTDQLLINRLDAQPKGFGSGIEVALDASWNAIPFSIDGHIGTFKGLREHRAPWPFDLNLKAVQTRATAKGQIGNLPELSGIELLVNAEGQDLARLGEFWGGPLPLKGRYRVSGKLTAPSSRDIYLSGLQVELENSTLQGELRAAARAGKPWVSGRLRAERLDLRPMLPAAKKSAGSPTARRSRVFSDAPLEAQSLERFDLDLDVAVNRLLLPQLALDQFHAVVKLADGRLVIDPLTAVAGGGPLKGQAALAGQAQGATLAADLVVEGLDLGATAKMLNSEDIAGRLDIDLHARGQGDSIAGIMGRLNGNLLIVLNDTRIPFRYLNLLGANMLNAVTRLANQNEKYSGPAVIHCLVGAFVIDDGLAKTEVLVADTESVTLSGVGTVDLKSEALKLGIETRAKEGFGTKATGKLSVDLSRVTKVFQLTGTLANPEFGLSTKKSLQTLVEAAGMTFLLGPVGLASLFLSKAETVENPCAAALAKAKAGPGKPQPAPKAAEKERKGLGSRLRNLFE